MNSSPSNNDSPACATKLWFENDRLCLALSDGREIRVPLDFYPRLRDASESQKNNFEIIGLGSGIHWPDIDEDLSVEGILLGRPSRL